MCFLRHGVYWQSYTIYQPYGITKEEVIWMYCFIICACRQCFDSIGCRQEGHPACKKKMRGWWRWALASPDGVKPSNLTMVIWAPRGVLSSLCVFSLRFSITLYENSIIITRSPLCKHGICYSPVSVKSRNSIEAAGRFELMLGTESTLRCVL